MGVAPNILLSSCNGRLMLLPWSFLISVWLFVKTIGEKVLLSMISLCPKGRCIEQVLKTDIWVDFMFIVILLYSVSITTLNSKQPHVLSFGPCIVGGRTTRHDMKTGLTCMQESHVIQCLKFEFLIPCPSLPSGLGLYCNLKWRYRLLIDFNLFTNEESMILIHLYFRHYCQGP